MFNAACQKLKSAETRYAALRAEENLLKEQLTKAVAEHEQAVSDWELYQKVTQLLIKTSEFAKTEVKKRIEDIVTSALNTVFEGDYSFTIDVVQRAGRIECDYFLENNNTKVQLSPPDYSRGGGVVDVICLALRLAVIELTGSMSNTVLLDEPTKHVSAEYAPNVADFLKSYSDDFGRQILCVTHQEALTTVADNKLCITQKNGRSEVVV